MTPIADMVEQMVADGVPMATILLAVRTAELAVASGKSGGIPVDRTAEKRRAYDRDRKAEKRNSGGKSGGIPPEQKTPSLSKKVKEEVIKQREAPQKRGTRIPPDWQPSEHDIEAAVAKGIALERIPIIAEKFKNHWLAKTGSKASSTNWHLNWCTWCINEIEWNGAKNGQRPHNANTRRSGTDDFFAGLAEVAADIDRDGAVARPADAHIPRGRVEIDGSGTP